MPFADIRGTSCYHILPVLLPAGLDRAQFMEGMKSRGVQTSIHYPPVHRFKIYEKDWVETDSPLPVTEDVSARQVTLPLYATLKNEQVEWVARAAQQVMKEIHPSPGSQ